MRGLQARRGVAAAPGKHRRATALGKMLVSLFIFACLGFQALAVSGLEPGPVESAPFLWPFIDYPMYSGAHFEGDEIDRALVLGVRADSARIPIEPADLGLGLFPYRRGPVRALRRGNLQAARLYRDIYAQRHGVDLIGFELKYRPIVVTRSGYHSAPDRIIASLYFELEKGERGPRE